MWRWETKPVWGGSQLRDPHIQTRSQATLTSKRVTREESKETHLSSSILVTGGKWWENSHLHSSLQSSVIALLHIKTGGIMGEWEFPNKNKKSSDNSWKETKYHQNQGILLRRDKLPRATKLRYTKDLCRREATEHLMDGNRRIPMLTTGNH